MMITTYCGAITIVLFGVSIFVCIKRRLGVSVFHHLLRMNYNKMCQIYSSDGGGAWTNNGESAASRVCINIDRDASRAHSIQCICSYVATTNQFDWGGCVYLSLLESIDSGQNANCNNATWVSMWNMLQNIPCRVVNVYRCDHYGSFVFDECRFEIYRQYKQ